MKLLAFDTSTHACTVAVIDTAKPVNANIVSKTDIQPMQQGKLILPMIDAVLQAAEISLSELDAIAYGQGPGSYTGTRIAASVVQGLSFVNKCKIVPVSSLATMAQAAYLKHGWQHIMVAVDARANQLYWAAYTLGVDELMTLQDQEQVTTPDKLVVPFINTDWYGIGDGWAAYGEIITKSIHGQPKEIDVNTLPLADAMLFLALNKLKHQQSIDVFNALPVYLR